MKVGNYFCAILSLTTDPNPAYDTREDKFQIWFVKLALATGTNSYAHPKSEMFFKNRFLELKKIYIFVAMKMNERHNKMTFYYD